MSAAISVIVITGHGVEVANHHLKLPQRETAFHHGVLNFFPYADRLLALAGWLRKAQADRSLQWLTVATYCRHSQFQSAIDIRLTAGTYAALQAPWQGDDILLGSIGYHLRAGGHQVKNLKHQEQFPERGRSQFIGRT